MAEAYDTQDELDRQEEQKNRSNSLILKCSTNLSMISSWALFLVWGGVSAYLYFNYFSGDIDWQRDWLLYLFVGAIFPGGALVAFVKALIVTARCCKYGETVFEIPQGSGTVGGKLSGSLRTGHDITQTKEYLFILECLETITYRGSSDGTKSKTHSRWRSEQKFHAQGYKSSRGFPVEFSIPETCLGCYDERAQGSISWVLTIKAATPGLNFEAKFDVPVYARDKDQS